MSDDEFQEIGPRSSKGEPRLTINIKFGTSEKGFYVSSATLTKLAVQLLALDDERHISIGISPSGYVRIRPSTSITIETAKVGMSWSVPRLASYCKEHGYRQGIYPVELRDGALYFQLERIEQEDAA